MGVEPAGSRPFGKSSVRLSPIAFGSMRLEQRGLDDSAWERLLRESLELGVTTLHSSDEYTTFGRFCGLLRRLDDVAGRFQHIVKLAEPHYDARTFDARRLVEKVDGYLNALRVERLDVVQWMWRGDLKREEERVTGFREQRAAIGSAFESLRGVGKIGVVAPFPYTVGFAELALGASFCAGLTVYLNPLEREMEVLVREAADKGLGIVAIRPLAAGKALEKELTPAICIRTVLAEPAVATAVVSYSSAAHLRELWAAVP